VSSIICWEEAGEVRCEREEDVKRRELEERLKQHLEAKLSEMLKTLVEQYEIEITVNVAEGKGVGRWRKKR
jgi:Ni,Fe-hydrogenase maturation factor